MNNLDEPNSTTAPATTSNRLPQPNYLDAGYTVFGRVVKGLEVLDTLQQYDTIDRVRVWDGVQMTSR